MSSQRFKMSFNTGNNFPIHRIQQNAPSSLANVPKQMVAPKAQALNAPMIERVYRARPGCSACGKKVA